MSAVKLDPERMALRAPPPRVMRLNRRVIVVIAGGLAAAVLLATLWSLRAPNRHADAGQGERFNVDRIARSEQLAQLPSDYEGVSVPALGAPLPGDLGTPMLRAGVPLQHGDAFHDVALARNTGAVDDELAAARSPLFFQTQGRGPASAMAAVGEEDPKDAGAVMPFDGLVAALGGLNAGTATQEVHDPKEAFMARGDSGVTRSAAVVQAPASPYQVMAGTVIPAALVTGINSDLPGQVIASVTEDVRDTATGAHLLIPQGSRLIGRYDSKIAFGQRRVLLVWTRLILPDASSIALDALPGVDPAGYAGLEDGVDWHWKRILGGAAVSTLLGIGAELAAADARTDEGRVVVAGRDGAQDTINQVGQAITQRNLDIQPTLTVRPGFPMRVMVNRDLVLRPYATPAAGRGAS